MNTIQIVALMSPLVVVLLLLTFAPLLFENFWRKYEKKFLFTTTAIAVVTTVLIVKGESKNLFYHTMIEDYVPFIITLFTLYILSTGISLKLNAKSTTLNNIIFLFVCSIFASLIGTTGASMVFIKPFLDMNKNRKYKAHLVVFFIFLVSNIGGLLTPLGDPPLLLGYLHGVNFFWCLKNLFSSWVFYVFSCLLVLGVIDSFILKKEKVVQKARITNKICLGESSVFNFLCILFSAFVLFYDIKYTTLILLIMSFISILKRKEKIDFAPFKEVALTFFTIFMVIAPVIFLLKEYNESISKICNGPVSYFWLCGSASSLLDNALSYLLFFNISGGDVQELMKNFPDVLKAISIGSVVMGAMTYIGNAPNMMVRSIAIKNKTKMPSFLGYVGWSIVIILPLSVLMCFVLL
ncbi:MAG: sodium:proton antiporter [Holosporales bacterium]|jgi:Na+/H+ antiporter NhaD/arsenite permease-like protein|nr:sodium:proton antiporter [Holosporales bacterium]